LPEIVLSLLSHQPDLVALTEFHAATGGSVRGILADAGLGFQATSSIDPAINSILIASRVPMEPTDLGVAFPGGDSRMLDVRLPTLGILVTGVHVPDDSRGADKLASWHYLVDLARERKEKSWIVLGDFNSGRHRLDEAGRSFKGTPLLGTFSSLGMLDAWRHLHPDSRERSWAHLARGSSRIDACFLSENLHKCLKTSHFSHVEREERLSDHSALIVDLEVSPRPVGCVEGGVGANAPGHGSAPETLFSKWKTRENPG
jgi:exonuclease III